MHKSKASRNVCPNTPAPWAMKEFSGAGFPDCRLLKRAQLIMTQFAKQPTASIPQACGRWADIKAAYRFFDNNSIDPQTLLEPHRRATVARMQEHDVVLAVQDTTSLNYSTHPQTRGLGPISNNKDKTIGLFLHTTLALSVTAEPLGVLGATVNVRDPLSFGKRRDSQRRNKTPLQDKESQRWLQSLSLCQDLACVCPSTTLVNVADREGDIYELFAQALNPQKGRPVHLLVRSQHNRKVEGPYGFLWNQLSQQPLAGTMQIKVPRQPGQSARTTILEIRFGEMTLCAPCLKEGQPSLKVWAIQAREQLSPKGQPMILWRLLTTLPVQSAAQAIEKVVWYTRRWQIEVMHKVLKSGCKVEQRQLESAARLKRILIMDLIVAWRVMLLGQTARERPQESADQWLLDSEWKVLWAYMNPNQPLPQQAPGLRQAVRWIGQLGGFIGRKSDGEPGPIVLWRGLQRLNDLARTWEMLKNVGNA